jgi:putative phosphoesterase
VGGHHMKKILLITDIHGNLPALQAVMQAVKEQEFEAILCNGDTIYGASPNQCLQILKEKEAIMIAGNAETNVIRLASKLLPPEWYHADQFEFTRKIAKNLTRENLLYIMDFSAQVEVFDLLPGSIRMVHGSPDDQYEWLSPILNPKRYQEVMQNLQEDILICGHTHQQWHRTFQSKLCINAGSVGLPLDGEPKAQYTIVSYQDDLFDSIKIEEYSIPYDIETAYQDFIKAGFSPQDPTIKLHKELLYTGNKRETPFVDFYQKLIQAETKKSIDQLSIEERNYYWHVADQKYQWKL